MRYDIFLLSLLHSDRPKFVYIFGLSECKSRDLSEHFRLDMGVNKNEIQQEIGPWSMTLHGQFLDEQYLSILIY